MAVEPEFDDEETLRSRKSLGIKTSPHLVWAARSSIGLRRSDNQDAWGERGGTRFVVADGVGGTDGGAIASAAAVAEFLSVRAPVDWNDALATVDEAVRFLCSSRGLPNAATTLVGCDFLGGALDLIHVGDSRAYRLRETTLDCLTEDHNLANLRRAEGVHPESDDGRGRPRALTSFLGAGNPDLQVDVLNIDAAPGDRFLLCSDGVHDQVSTKHLNRILSGHDVAGAATAIVEAADAAGGRDNATAIVIALPAT